MFVWLIWIAFHCGGIEAQLECSDVYAQTGSQPVLPFRRAVPATDPFFYKVVFTGVSATLLAEWGGYNGVVKINITLYEGCFLGPNADIQNGTIDIQLPKVSSTSGGQYELWSTLTTPVVVLQCIHLYIIVPVTSVRLTDPSEDTVTVTENHDISFTCSTNAGIPRAIVEWYNDAGTSSDVADDQLLSSTVSNSVYNNSTMITTSILTLTANRDDHGTSMYCRARNLNTTAWLTSNRMVKLTVWYAPGPIAIEGLTNNSTYYVIRNTSQTLTCSVKGGRPQPQLSWSCNIGQLKNTTTIIIDDTVSSSVTWTSVELENTCICTSQHIVSGQTNAVVFTKVLYPPETPSLTMDSKDVSSIYLTEGESLTVTCNSSSSPSPSRFTWHLPNGLTTQGQQLSIDRVQYHVIPVYKCIVENVMAPSFGAEVTGSSSKSLPVILSYSPRHVNKYTSKEKVEAVPGKKAVLIVSLAAFPLPTVYIWSSCKTTAVCSVIHSDTNIIISTFGLTSNLTILNTRPDDFGQYELMVGNGIGQPYNFTFFLREKVSANAQDSTETSTSLICGVVGGVVVLAVIVVAVVVVLCLIRRKTGGGKETTLYQNSKQQDEYADVHEQTLVEQTNPSRITGAGISATSTSYSEYIGLSHYGNVQNTYEELGGGTELHTPTEKMYTNVIS